MPSVKTSKRKTTVPAERLSPITALRERAGLSQNALASLVGVTRSAVNLWERSGQEPKGVARQKLAAALRITVGELGRLMYEQSAGLDPDASFAVLAREGKNDA